MSESQQPLFNFVISGSEEDTLKTTKKIDNIIENLAKENHFTFEKTAPRDSNFMGGVIYDPKRIKEFDHSHLHYSLRKQEEKGDLKSYSLKIWSYKTSGEICCRAREEIEKLQNIKPI